MKPNIAAALGLRLLGVTAILLGFALVGSLAVPRYQWFLAPVPSVAPDHVLHDTYYIIYTAHLAPGVCSIVLGIILLALSRPVGRLLARGLAEPSEEHN